MPEPIYKFTFQYKKSKLVSESFFAEIYGNTEQEALQKLIDVLYDNPHSEDYVYKLISIKEVLKDNYET